MDVKQKTTPPLLSTVKSSLSKSIERMKQLKTSSDKISYTQDYVPIQDIYKGMIFTTDGKVINILEILPLNYSEESDSKKDMIANAFGIGFKQLPDNGHIKVMNAHTDLSIWENNIRLAMSSETDETLLKRMEDYIAHTKKIQKQNSVCKRFFYIYEYMGDDNGKKSDDFEDIYFTMIQTQRAAINALSGTGNVIIDLQHDPQSLANVLYMYFNPKSSKENSLDARINKVTEAVEYYNKGKTNDEKIVGTLPDYLAPRGMKFGKWDWARIDGLYHTYLTLKDVSYPDECQAGWLTHIIDNLPTGDLDIYYRKITSGLNDFLIDRTEIINRGLVHTHQSTGDIDAQEELMSNASNARYIKELTKKQGEELYEVNIIVTLRADTYKDMLANRNTFLKQMKAMDLHFDKSFMKTQLFFKMTMPLMYIDNEIFHTNCRNMTNSSLATLYCFNSYTMFDDDCACMGTLHKNSTLFGYNNFSKKSFVNPHIFIAGGTGSGKTVTECMMMTRKRMRGERTMCILPLKGHEYQEAVETLDGNFISLRPGGEACINICEIYPSSIANLEDITDDQELYKEIKNLPSFLTQKITSLVNWVRIQMGGNLSKGEAGELNVAFTKVYADFGITEDNMSLWEDVTALTIKKMPIIEDLYNAIKDIPSLAQITSTLKVWVYGNCKNMNGQTNVDFSNKVIAFDINEDYTGEELLPVFMYMAFDICYGIARRDLNEECNIILDETWKFLVIPECAKHIYKMIKILRAYNTSVISATQDIEDAMRSEYGRSLLTQSATKIYLKMNETEIKTLGSSMDLSEYNKNLLQSVPAGYGFVCVNADRLFVHFDPSLWELEIYEPDKVKKAEIRQRRMAMGIGA